MSCPSNIGFVLPCWKIMHVWSNTEILVFLSLMDGLRFSSCYVFLFLYEYIETVVGRLCKNPDICRILHLVLCQFDI